MFLEKLKRQYWAYLLVVTFIAARHVLIHGFSHPVALNVVVHVFLVSTLSFLLFCISFCLMTVGKWLLRSLGCMK